MRILLIIFAFLFLVEPVNGLEVHISYSVKLSGLVKKTYKKVLVASYSERKTQITTWDLFKEKAQEIAKENDYPLSVLLGQAALESAKGTSYYATNRFNFFGINAIDENPDLAHEYRSIEEGIRAYIHLIKTQYSEAYKFRDDPHKMIEMIKNAGYASDSDYVSKVTNLPEFKDNL